MCGIVGIHSLSHQRPIDSDVLTAMNDVLTHRGPDSAGQYIDPGRVGLAMRRLSIIDVAGGDQPISNEDGTIWIVFNGEVYNFPSLRTELERRGHRFRTDTDTETIVHAYEEWGDECVHHLRGMFAFAIWDAPRDRLLLVRDRVGIKQLYFTRVGGQLLWGSEIKAILAHPAVERRLRPAAVNHFLTYLYVPEPLTMFEGIEELRAGHLLIAERGQLKVRRYWNLDYPVDESMSFEEATEGLRAQLDEAVRLRLISDVPLGAFLSGGIDSGSVVALMAKHSNAAVNTFSIGYASGGEAFDERVYARELAEKYGTRHHEFEMAPDVVEILTSLVRAFDQPSADSTAIPTWYLSKYTREHVTVALSGLGGDEIAAGYERHRGALLAERLGWLPLVVPPWTTPAHGRKTARTEERPPVYPACEKIRDVHGPAFRRTLLPISLADDTGRESGLVGSGDPGTDRSRRSMDPLSGCDRRRRRRGSAQPCPLRRPEALPARRSPYAHRSHLNGTFPGGARSLPRP